MKNSILMMAVLLGCSAAAAGRTVTTLRDGWQFAHGHAGSATQWQSVRIPHDWAISGPFDIKNDLQTVRVEQNGETKASLKTGRSGGLPFIGKGVYKTSFEVGDTAGRNLTLLFDGAMSHARVILNGRELAFRPYGYTSFFVDLTGTVRPGSNDLTVELENKEKATRWYPGAGLYRNVHLINTDRVHIPVWGTYVTTPSVSADRASVRLDMEIAGVGKIADFPNGESVGVKTSIIAPDGSVAASDSSVYIARGQNFTQYFLVEKPDLWDTENPALYTARTELFTDGRRVDSYDTRFGIRRIEYLPEKGFFLNGVPTKFKGVNNHHDLGPLGAAVNRSALRHQLSLLKDMGVNAIRTSHNMPAPELVELCDEMGLMMMVEPFDDWGFKPKSQNGYGVYFKDWAERDLTGMIRQFRNSPSVVMWSIGNEVTSQWGEPGMDELVMLRDLTRRLDPTRPITSGMDQINSILDNGFAAALDIPSFNYKPTYYQQIHDKLPQKLLLCSESASTVSSRGQYMFPVELPDTFYSRNGTKHANLQVSAYDTETCPWANTPDIDFAMDDDHDWVLGQFVWTGFDYLGEPSPYDKDSWPSHSSYFGIIDLASIPKDRYYLYRSHWNTKDHTLHMLPHWNWEGREGEVTPVFVYTDSPKAELFINGKSQGIREKNDSSYLHRYRLMWMDTRYEPGEVRVVAYNADGTVAGEKTMRTAGKPHHLVASSNRGSLIADGDDMAYLTVRVADKDGNILHNDTRRVKFRVTGQGAFEATANGDATCLLPFTNPEMDLFGGAATAIVRSSDKPGTLTFTATAKGLKPAVVTIPVK